MTSLKNWRQSSYCAGLPSAPPLTLPRLAPSLPPLQDPDHLLLFELLQEPIAQRMLGEHAATLGHIKLLTCWADIEEFKDESVSLLVYARFVDIYDHYIDPMSPCALGLGPGEVERYEDLMTACIFESSCGSRCTKTLLAEVQQQCFTEIYSEIFSSFTTSECFEMLKKQLKKKYEKIQPSDFDYFEALRTGKCGSVFKARKKTTKVLYALKILAKDDLLKEAVGGGVVDLELKELKSIRHPFIIHMEYSFHTPKLAVIVMELAEGGTLKNIPAMLSRTVLTESQVRYYVAEIVEALHFLHSLGFIYRDLKPTNVLIDKTGHVKLADLAGMSDSSGRVAGLEKRTRGPLSAYACGGEAPAYRADTPLKRKSVFGTRGFMSPQMVEVLSLGRQWASGYSYMTDYWSLGVLVYHMLTGFLPFEAPSDGYTPERELQLMKRGRIEFPPETSLACQNFVCSLLEVDENRRLGFGRSGIEYVKKHPFFKQVGFEWSKVITKRFDPPVVPSDLFDISTPAAPIYNGFDDLPMCMVPKGHVSVKMPSLKDQELFNNWDYIAPTTLSGEFGMEHDPRQFGGRKVMKMGRGMSGTSTATSSSTSSTNVSSPACSARGMSTPNSYERGELGKYSTAVCKPTQSNTLAAMLRRRAAAGRDRNTCADGTADSDSDRTVPTYVNLNRSPKRNKPDI
jgi:serine/threonine protein kinase